jgi:hypothetical protein
MKKIKKIFDIPETPIIFGVMQKQSPLAEGDLVAVAVKLPSALHDKICELAPFLRGGKSEVIRRALVTGLPLVITQRGIRLPAKGAHK